MIEYLLEEDEFNINDFLGDEELDPELEEYKTDGGSLGTMIQHPLAYSIMHSPALNKMMNKTLKMKKEELAKALEKKDYNRYVFVHERPYRINAFVDIMNELGKKEYYILLGDIWTDSENIWQFEDVLPMLLMRYPKYQKWMMSSEDRATLASLPATVKVYRGADNKNKLGWSWTIDLDKATWFANRYGHKGKVYNGTCNKSDIIAYLSERGESEIIIDPKKVTIKRK